MISIAGVNIIKYYSITTTLITMIIPTTGPRWPQMAIYSRATVLLAGSLLRLTANLRTKIMDFGGFDSSIILIIRGGIVRPIGIFSEDLSQAMLVGAMLVGRLGVL